MAKFGGQKWPIGQKKWAESKIKVGKSEKSGQKVAIWPGSAHFWPEKWPRKIGKKWQKSVIFGCFWAILGHFWAKIRENRTFFEFVAICPLFFLCFI